MTCSVPSSERKAYVQRVVREAIKSLCPPTQSVTQDTALGPIGLGHGNPIRRKYHERIKQRLDPNGCRMKTLTPDSFADSALVWVRDVSALVLADLD